jgi:hypothetical protein
MWTGKAGPGLIRAYGDPVEVWVADGRPSRFVWHGRLYSIRNILDTWVASRDWVREPESEDVTEREFWRVEASPDREIGVYELRHDLATDSWMLSRGWN